MKNISWNKGRKEVVDKEKGKQRNVMTYVENTNKLLIFHTCKM